MIAHNASNKSNKYAIPATILVNFPVVWKLLLSIALYITYIWVINNNIEILLKIRSDSISLSEYCRAICYFGI